MPSRIIVFIYITTISSSNVFADKNHVAPRLSLVNILGLNKLLRFEIFISEDRQLQAAHLILDYEPLSHIFQDVGQAIRAGDPKQAHINVSKPGFLARRDLPPVELPIQHVPQEVASPREETASAPLSLEVEINQFHLKEEGEVLERPIELSDSEADLDRFSTAHSPRLITARVDISLEDEEEGMDLKPRTSLKGLLANRNKGSSSKEVPKTQVPSSLPPPPFPVTAVGLLPNPDLKRKRKVQEMERGEVIPPKGAKQPKNVKDKKAPSVESREESNGVEVRREVHTWAPQQKMDGAPIT